MANKLGVVQEYIYAQMYGCVCSGLYWLSKEMNMEKNRRSGGGEK